MKINKELLKGSSELLVLATIQKEPLYGYEIAKRIKTASDQLFTMGEGTLYPILHKLEQDGLLESFWEEFGGRNRKYYSITRTGKQLLKEKKQEWETFTQAIQAVILG
jgi:transcriptional regulator